MSNQDQVSYHTENCIVAICYHPEMVVFAGDKRKLKKVFEGEDKPYQFNYCPDCGKQINWHKLELDYHRHCGFKPGQYFRRLFGCQE